MDAFRQRRTGERARRLSLAQLACLGRHTLTGLLCACGRQFLDWSADYRLFSKDRWEVRQLFVPLLRGLLDMLRPIGLVVIAPVGYRPRRGRLARPSACSACWPVDRSVRCRGTQRRRCSLVWCPRNPLTMLAWAAL